MKLTNPKRVALVLFTLEGAWVKFKAIYAALEAAPKKNSPGPLRLSANLMKFNS